MTWAGLSGSLGALLGHPFGGCREGPGRAWALLRGPQAKGAPKRAEALSTTPGDPGHGEAAVLTSYVSGRAGACILSSHPKNWSPSGARDPEGSLLPGAERRVRGQSRASHAAPARCTPLDGEPVGLGRPAQQLEGRIPGRPTRTPNCPPWSLARGGPGAAGPFLPAPAVHTFTRAAQGRP